MEPGAMGRGWATTVALGVSMTVSYGTLFYSFAPLAASFMAEFGWSRSFVFGVFSAALLAGGVVAPITGWLIDRHGARPVMSAGSIAAAIALLFLSRADGEAQFIAAVMICEMTALAVQYEAGFAALARIHGREARGPITGVTLIAGFSSTVFWPLIGWLLHLTDWRTIYLILAALNLIVCLPIHLALPRRCAGPATGSPDLSPSPLSHDLAALSGRKRRRVLWLMLLAFTASGFVVSAVQSGFLVILADFGYAPAVAATIGALIGPSQVGARVVEMIWGRRGSPVLVGLLANASAAFGVLCLLFAASGEAIAILFAIAYGAGQGLAYIVRGVIPLHFFGPQGYGALTGKLSAVRIAFSAAAPVSVAVLSDTFGVEAGIALMLLAAFIGVAAMAGLLAIDRKVT